MMRTTTIAGQCLVAALLVALGLGTYGCGDTGTVNPEVELSRLTVSPGTLQPGFSGQTTQYVVDLGSNVATVTVSAQPAASGDTVSINDQATTSRAITLRPAGETTPVNIVVSESTTSSRTYTVLLRRAGFNGNNSLQRLTISSGTLAPTFSANTLRYTADVANNVIDVAVTPTLQDPDATMTVDGQATTSGQARTVRLNGPGLSTVIDIVVTAQNGTPKTYLVTVRRGGLSSNNFLQSLGISPGPLVPVFEEDTEDYTVNVGSGVGTVTVTPRLSDPAATITVTSNGQVTTSGQARTITLRAAGLNTNITIRVVAPNGTPKIYTVEVRRAALGGNNNLSALTISPETLAPPFSSGTEDYTVEVGSGVEEVSIRPTLSDSAATMTINGTAATSGQTRTITLRAAGLSTVINIVVTAPNGTRKTYSVAVDRAALAGNDNLQNLTVSPGTLSPPPFTASRTVYTVGDVSSSATSILVTATPQDSSASVTINDQGGNSRSISLPGGPSRTEIEVRVIAPNGNDKTYLITVNQPAPAEPPAPASAPDLIPEDDSCTLDLPPNQNECFVPAPPATNSRDDNITNIQRPRFRIPPPSAGTPSLYVDANKDASASFDSAANTLRPSFDLPDGVHTITYTVTNGGGESDPSPPLTVTIDTDAPAR